jgi:hypothetical protein
VRDQRAEQRLGAAQVVLVVVAHDGLADVEHAVRVRRLRVGETRPF